MNDKCKIRLVAGIRAIFACLMLGFLSINPAIASDTPCGHKDQRACPALRKGPECFDYTQKINGICRARGGEGEQQYKKGLGFIGFDCKPGYQKDPKKKGYCTACGDLNQPSCEAARPGPRCDKGLTHKKVGSWEKCVPDNGIEKELKKQATEKIKSELQYIVDIGMRAFNERTHQSQVRSAVDDYRSGRATRGTAATAGIVGAATGNDIQPLVLHGAVGIKSLNSTNSSGNAGNYESWTLGAGGDANAGVGVSIEQGMAFALSNMRSRKGYTSFTTDFQIGFGGSAGVTVGLSTSAYNGQGGKSLGYKVSVTSVIDMVKNLKNLEQIVERFKSLKTAAPDLSIGVWFARKGNGGVGAYQGLTATIGGAIGPSVGATYSQGQTWQF
ncbi:MAG: hypothetical protein ACREVC_07375 [Burkholderiales bacterium]